MGSVARYGIGLLVQTRAGDGFPFSTLAVNVSGSILLGLLLGSIAAAPAVRPEVRVLMTTGFCGGYTTFSTFAYETVALAESGDWRRAMLYVGTSVLVSLAGMFLGLAAARQLLRLYGTTS
jgi:CrcB protein